MANTVDKVLKVAESEVGYLEKSQKRLIWRESNYKTVRR